MLYCLSLHCPHCKLRYDTDNTGVLSYHIKYVRVKERNKMPQSCAQQRLCFLQNSPVLIFEDKLLQFEVTKDQSIVMTMCHSRGYLIEESGSFVLPQLLAGADKRVHVTIASLKEHVGSCLPEQDLQDLVNMLVLPQGKIGRQ